MLVCIVWDIYDLTRVSEQLSVVARYAFFCCIISAVAQMVER